MQYTFKVEILKRETEENQFERFISFQSPKWYDRLFRTAVAIIWSMEELKEKVRGKED